MCGFPKTRSAFSAKILSSESQIKVESERRNRIDPIESHPENQSIVNLPQGRGHRRCGLDLRKSHVTTGWPWQRRKEAATTTSPRQTRGRKCNRSQEFEIESNFLHPALSLLSPVPRCPRRWFFLPARRFRSSSPTVCPDCLSSPLFLSSHFLQNVFLRYRHDSLFFSCFLPDMIDRRSTRLLDHWLELLAGGNMLSHRWNFWSLQCNNFFYL